MNLTLKTLRKRYNLSQEDLANLLGTSQGEISRIENGIRKPRPATATRIRSVFGLTTEQIWTMFYEGGDDHARAETVHRQ